MSMQQKPTVSLLPDGGKYRTHDFEDFSAMVYVPAGDPSAEVINYGFRAPHLLVFGEPDRSIGDAAGRPGRSFSENCRGKQNRPVL